MGVYAGSFSEWSGLALPGKFGMIPGIAFYLGVFLQ